MLKKGAGFYNVMIFIGAWATTKLPLLLFEAANLGTSYMLMRFAFNVVGIVLIAFLLEKSMTKDEVNELNSIVNSGNLFAKAILIPASALNRPVAVQFMGNKAMEYSTTANDLSKVIEIKFLPPNPLKGE